MGNGLTDIAVSIWIGWSGVFGWAGPLKEPLAILFFLSLLASFLGWLGKLGAPPKVLDVAGLRKSSEEKIRAENPGITDKELAQRVDKHIGNLKAIFRKQGYVIPPDREG